MIRKNGKYLLIIINDSAIICDEIIKKQPKEILMKIKQPVKHKISIFPLHFC